MKGRHAVCIASVCLSACQNYNGTPVDAYQRGSDRIAILTGLAAMNAVWPCMDKGKVVGDAAAYAQIPDDQCYRMDPPRRWRGLLRRGDDIEQFCPDPATTCSYKSSRNRTWIYWKTADVLKALGRLPGSGLFRVDLIGRKTSVKGRYGYGDYDNEIVVSRVISIGTLLSDDVIKTLRASAPGMTEACIDKLRSEGIEAMPQRPDECFTFDGPRRWQGVWVNAFEGSEYCPRLTRSCGRDVDDESTWLEFASYPSAQDRMRPGGVYDVEFVGRRSRGAGIFGHFGIFKNDIIVDRMISMKELQKPYAK